MAVPKLTSAFRMMDSYYGRFGASMGALNRFPPVYRVSFEDNSFLDVHAWDEAEAMLTAAAYKAQLYEKTYGD